MIIHVRNFGRIETADIDLSNLVIFVGENNSGKTYLMQLIYGLFSFFSQSTAIASNNLANELGKVFVKRFDEQGQILISGDNTDFYNAFQTALNDYINNNKESIIESIFHTNSLSLDSLSVEFEPLPDEYSVSFTSNVEKEKGVFRRYSINKNQQQLFTIGFGEAMPDTIANYIKSSELVSLMLSDLTGLSINERNRRRGEKSFVYFPASRSGMLLLYANYLSNDKKNFSVEEDDYAIERNEQGSSENEYGLTEPVYDFLMFLLKYKRSDITTEQNKDLLSFVENHIINGHLKKDGSTMVYKPNTSEQIIPIYLSSSLVSELAPLYQVLSGVQRFNYIMYDEIETCQHPTKQLQLARLLVRMVNLGYKMIVSTHSDTMATAINNLITLSYKQNKKSLLEKLGYDEEDILRSAHVNAYQFIMESGKTKVIEVPNHFSVGVGFDFDLFNAANKKIYDDAVTLAEVD